MRYDKLFSSTLLIYGMFILLYKVGPPFESVDASVTVHIKAIVRYFPVVQFVSRCSANCFVVVVVVVVFPSFKLGRSFT